MLSLRNSNTLTNIHLGLGWFSCNVKLPCVKLMFAGYFAGQQETGAVAEAEGAGTSFDWNSNWYPVFPEIDADKAIPHPFQVKKHFMVNLQFKWIYCDSKIGHIHN